MKLSVTILAVVICVMEIILSAATAAPLDSLYRQELLNLNPVAYYGLDESGGATVAVDEIPPAANGIVAGAVSMGAPSSIPSLGTSADFNGAAGTNIDLGNPAKLQTNAMTVVFWMNSATSDDGIITKGESRSGASGRNWDVFGAGSQLRFLGTSSSNFIFNIGTPFPTLNEWHMVAATWDGTTNINGVKLYLDGSLAAEGTSTGTTLNTDKNLFIGGESSAYTFDGQLDEVAFFNTALTDTNISDLYALSSQLASPAPEPGALLLVSSLLPLLVFQRRKYKNFRQVH